MSNYTDILININVLYKFYNIIISTKYDSNKHKIKYYDLLDVLSKYNIKEDYIIFNSTPKWIYCEFIITSAYLDSDKYHETFNYFNLVKFNDLLINDTNIVNITSLEIHYGIALLSKNYNYSDIEIVDINNKLFLPTNINNYASIFFEKTYQKSEIIFFNNLFKMTEKIYQICTINKNNINCIISTHNKKNVKNSKKVKYFIRKEKMLSIIKKII